MQQAVIAQFPKEIVRYELIVRTPREFPPNFAHLLRNEINALSDLRVTSAEIEFLKKTCYFLKPPYLDFLRGYQFDPQEVKVSQDQKGIHLQIEGYWYRTILWEVPLMAIISELFFKLTSAKFNYAHKIVDITRKKIEHLEAIGAKFSEFGTRRRFSFANHDMAVSICKEYAPTMFVGTSNPHLAMKYGVKAMGTQAHEWYMAIAALYGFESANQVGMEKWVDVYEGDLGIALTDTFTTNVFFNAFNTKYAKLFDGIRQDSGAPLLFAEKAIEHYKNLRIDPRSKTIVFSDNLNVNTVEEIRNYCKGKINDSYGIGTNLTNDVGEKPLNMVIKLVGIKIRDQWVNTVKLSDDPGKHTGPIETVERCKEILRIK